MNKYIGIAILFLAAITGGLSGCGSSAPAAKQSGGAGNPAAAPTNPLAESFFLKEAPAGAKDVAVVKKDAKEGDEVVIKGRVGGRKDDTFTHGRAMMYIMDMGLQSCNMRQGDDCPTPWDYCCEDADTITKNIAAIQFVDAEGKVLKNDLKGSNGLDHLSVVTVKGKVGKRDDPKVLIVTASGIHVEKSAAKKTN